MRDRARVGVEVRFLCVRKTAFAELARRPKMPDPPSVGMVIHQDVDKQSRSELVTSVGWLEGEKHYLCQLADDAALDLEDEEEAFDSWRSR
jgi:hypothetical protein